MISEKQKKILAFPYSSYDALICDGAVRSGKTSIMTVGFVDWAMRCFSGCRFGICGKTVDSAVKNIVVPYTQMSYANDRYTIKWRRSDKIMEVRRGKTVNVFEVFGGKDEASAALIQGRTLAGVLLDEVALMPKSFVQQALARCSVDGAKIWFSCNPDSPEHWFYKEWICEAEQKNALYLHFAMTDNPSLSAETLRKYETYYSGVFYDRYIKGLWVVAEGLVYDFFGEDQITDKIPERGEYYISIDYGTLNPFSAGLWCWDGKCATRIREYYYSGRDENRQKTDEEYYQDLEALAGDLNIYRVIVDPSAASFIETIRRHGRFSVRHAKNDVLDGIIRTRRLLKSGIIKIHRSCKDEIREFGLYRWDENSVVDVPVKENDHCLSGETLVDTLTGQKKIKDLVGKIGLVWSATKHGKRCIRPFFGVRKTQENKKTLKITLENGKQIKCTPEHRILTENGWVMAKYLTESNKVLDISVARPVGIKKIEVSSNEDVYNMEVVGTHCFSVNGGLIVHNCMDETRYFVNTVMTRLVRGLE